MERTTINYTDRELKRINNKKELFILEYEDLEIQERENRTEDIKLIMEIVMDKSKIKIMIIGRTQSGKTYILLSIIRELIKQDTIPIDNIYVITGLSSKDWKEQTKKRFPNCLANNVLHLGDIGKSKFVETMRGRKNIKIFIDENQIASSHKNTLSKQFKLIGFNDYKYLYKNNIQIIERIHLLFQMPLFNM